MKKNLHWRLKELPTGDDLASMVEQKILTPEEARSIAVDDQEKHEELKALKEQVTFLQGVIDKLIAREPREAVWKHVETFAPHYAVTYSNTTTPLTSLTTGAVYLSSSNISALKG